MYEVLHNYLPKIEVSTILEKLQLEKQKYFVVSAHRGREYSKREKLLPSSGNIEHGGRKVRLPGNRFNSPRTRKMVEKKGWNFTRTFA